MVSGILRCRERIINQTVVLFQPIFRLMHNMSTKNMRRLYFEFANHQISNHRYFFLAYVSFNCPNIIPDTMGHSLMWILLSLRSLIKYGNEKKFYLVQLLYSLDTMRRSPDLKQNYLNTSEHFLIVYQRVLSEIGRVVETKRTFPNLL